MSVSNVSLINDTMKINESVFVVQYKWQSVCVCVCSVEIFLCCDCEQDSAFNSWQITYCGCGMEKLAF